VRTSSRATLMAGRTARSFVVNGIPDKPSPGAFWLHCLTPKPELRGDGVFLSSYMELTQDVMRSRTQPHPASHADEPRRAGSLAGDPGKL
jgi:hypothetical protein